MGQESRRERAGKVATHPGMAETLRGDWRKAAWFYARFGITERNFRNPTD